MTENVDPAIIAQRAASSHKLLRSRFQTYARNLRKHFMETNDPLQGELEVIFEPGRNEIHLHIAERDLRIVFRSTMSDERGYMTGKVLCILARVMDKSGYWPMGEFCFSPDGITNLEQIPGYEKFLMEDALTAVVPTHKWIISALQHE